MVRRKSCPFCLLNPNERVMQSTQVRHPRDGASTLYGAPKRRILTQGEVRSNGVVKCTIDSQNAAQVRFVRDDQMIEKFAADGPDQSFDIDICHGLRGAIGRSRMPIDCTLRLYTWPYERSRSRMR